jgi:hypothetical protein
MAGKGQWGYCKRHWRQERERLGPRRTIVWGTPEERFWVKVTRGKSCWVWKARRGRGGYGQFKVDRGGKRWVTMPAHRFSWELAHGPIPDEMLVLHRCDNPPCVRPDHLYLGTHADNARDRDSQGRGRQCPPELHAKGERVGLSKLTEAAVRDIRARYAKGGISQQALADEYGVVQTIVSRVIRRETWRHV